MTMQDKSHSGPRGDARAEPHEPHGRDGAGSGTEELRHEVDRARHDLGETVEALAARADVKAMAREKVAEAKARARSAVASARGAAASRAASAKAAASSPKARKGAGVGGAVAGTAGAAVAAA
uniref:DUF3618 domain-containing protein n=1 Tax=Actinomadura litoris TaxID=2678616 RepID=UPI001FA71915